MSLNYKKGFTLLEIIIVVAIIAVLAAILLPRITGVRRSVNDTIRINDLRKVQGYLELDYTKKRTYPLLTAGTGQWTTLGSTLGQSLPQDPTPSVTGKSYEYSASSDGQSYVLRATLDNSGVNLGGDEVDGSPNSLDCEDNLPSGPFYYCIQF